jgi:hypothetical protein
MLTPSRSAKAACDTSGACGAAAASLTGGAACGATVGQSGSAEARPEKASLSFRHFGQRTRPRAVAGSLVNVILTMPPVIAEAARLASGGQQRAVFLVARCGRAPMKRC